MSNPTILVLGAGPGLGGAVARRFGRDGYDVALLSLDEDQLIELGEALQAEGITTGWTALDITDAGALTAAVRRFGDHSGRIDVLHFNPSAYRAKDVLALSAAELAEDIGLGVGALLTGLQAARPYLHRGARITATGSMAADQPNPEAASLGVQKAGLRNLVSAADATLRGAGIRAVSVTVCGALSREGPFAPERIADAIFAAAGQEEASWKTEIAYTGQGE